MTKALLACLTGRLFARLPGSSGGKTRSALTRLTGVRMVAVVSSLCILLNLASPLAASPRPAAPSGEHSAQRTIPSKPLVLIGEPSDNDGPSVWTRAGLVSRLEESGYRLGTTLFVHTPGEPYGDLDSGAHSLRKVLEQTVDDTGCGILDVAAYGVSGLVLRFGLETGIIRDGLVDNAIMLSTPQRGSFLADLLFQACTVVKHECMFEQETRYSRFSPLGDVSSVLDPAAISPRSTGDLPSSLGTGNFQWESEAWWVAKRAREIYEPLYSQYVQERFLSLPYVPADSPTQTFAGWIKQNRPLIWENCIAGGTRPPLGPSAETSDGPPQAGQDFTVAYYELLAMAVGRNQYVVRMASSGSLGQSLLAPSQGPGPGSLKDAIIHYGLKALLHYAKKALITVKAEVQRIIADRIVSSIGYLDGPESPFLRRLVKEEALVNLGTSAGQRFYRVPANYYLEQLNRMASSSAYTRKTRFVTVTGKVTNLLGLVWPQVGPNDLFCEVDSAVPPQGPRDVIRVFSGFLSPSYLNLLKDKQVQQTIVALLLEPDKTARFNAVQDMEEIAVSSWQPSYVAPVWDTAGDRVFNVSVSVPSLPEGWGCALWVEGYDGERWLPVSGWHRMLAGGAKAEVLLKHECYRVGLKLVRTGTVNPYTPGGKVESVFERELISKVRVSVDGFMGDEGPPLQGDWDGRESAEFQWGQGTWDQGALDKEDKGIQGPVQDVPGEEEDIPTVRVVYRSKHTTLWKPQETYHSYWEVDFGDGETVVIQGQPHLEVAHTFGPSGRYLVRAVSYDNHDNVLLEKSWHVATDEAPETREFSCSSVTPPEVYLELTGPLKWVTGKYALFSGKAAWRLPEGARVTAVDFDPGESFRVLWERSGEFTVLWGVRLTIEYELEDRVVRVKNTYVTQRQVDVFTPGITR